MRSMQDLLRDCLYVSQTLYYKKALCVIISFCRYDVDPDKGFVDLGHNQSSSWCTCGIGVYGGMAGYTRPEQMAEHLQNVLLQYTLHYVKMM